jgi:hypothetical protein
MTDAVDFGHFDGAYERNHATPSPRASASSCCDNETGETLVFGGMGPQEYFNDLHLFSMATMSWAPVEAEYATRPSPRGAAAMCHVRLASGERRVVVFGGRSDDGLLGDLHSLGPQMTYWTRHAPSGERPCARDDAVAVTGASDALGGASMVIVGGTNGRHEPLGDVWVYNPTRGAWTRAKTSGDEPEHGIAAAGASKITHDKAVVVGGFDTRKFLGDVRLLDLRTFFWRRLDVASGGAVPRPRTHAAIGLVGRQLYLHGGYCGSAAQVDLWRLPLGADALDEPTLLWEQVELPEAAVAARGAAVPLIGTCGDGRRAFGAFGGFDGAAFLDTVFVARLGAPDNGVSRELPHLDADVAGLQQAVEGLKRSMGLEKAAAASWRGSPSPQRTARTVVASEAPSADNVDDAVLALRRRNRELEAENGELKMQLERSRAVIEALVREKDAHLQRRIRTPSPDRYVVPDFV